MAHTLQIYSYIHPRIWDDSLPYIHHSYNVLVYHSIRVTPFMAYMGFLSKSPLDLHLTILSSTSLNFTSTFKQ